jgi:hypothetical protein
MKEIKSFLKLTLPCPLLYLVLCIIIKVVTNITGDVEMGSKLITALYYPLLIGAIFGIILYVFRVDLRKSISQKK